MCVFLFLLASWYRLVFASSVNVCVYIVRWCECLYVGVCLLSLLNLTLFGSTNNTIISICSEDIRPVWYTRCSGVSDDRDAVTAVIAHVISCSFTDVASQVVKQHGDFYNRNYNSLLATESSNIYILIKVLHIHQN